MQSEIKHCSNFTIPQFATKKTKTRNVEIKTVFVVGAYLLVTSNMYSPSTVKYRMGFPYYEKCFTFFPFQWRLLWGLHVGRCKTEGVRLNKRFVSVLHEITRSWSKSLWGSSEMEKRQITKFASLNSINSILFDSIHRSNKVLKTLYSL